MHSHAFSAPGVYRIIVQGQLHPNWSNRVGGLRIMERGPAEGSDVTVTVLQGRVCDQAELSGILNTLYELHLPLISVQHQGDE